MPGIFPLVVHGLCTCFFLFLEPLAQIGSWLASSLPLGLCWKFTTSLNMPTPSLPVPLPCSMFVFRTYHPLTCHILNLIINLLTCSVCPLECKLYESRDLFCSLIFYSQCLDHYRRRQWHPTPVLLPGKSHGRRSLVGCSPWGRQLFPFMHWRRKWQPTPVFLPGESPERGSLVGCRLWGGTESDMTERLSSSSSRLLWVLNNWNAHYRW